MRAREIAQKMPGAVPLVRRIRRIPLSRRIRGERRRRNPYWAGRRHMIYYREVLRLAGEHAGEARSVLDVGSHYVPFLREFRWIPEKVSLDRSPGELPGARAIQADFLVWEPDQRYDLVICLQVLEHLEDPGPFAQKLLGCGRVVILSVPYRWPKGQSRWHVQDPVDEAKVSTWLGRPWDDQAIATEPNGSQRLIVVVK